MHTTNLRKVGGSIMLAVPPALLEQLKLKAGSAVNISMEGDKLVIESSTKPKYTMSELLAQSDYSQIEIDREWVYGSPAGNELL